MVAFAQPFRAYAVTPLPDRFALANARALASLRTLLQKWLPGGYWDREEYVVRNPRRDDHHAGSFRINATSGVWADFATGDRGGDPTSLYAYVFAVPQIAALRALEAGQPHSSVIHAIPAKAANVAKTNVPTMEAARKLYQKAGGIGGTEAEAYLTSRALLPSSDWRLLRFSYLPYRGSGHFPTLIAPVHDREGRLSGIQRTYLSSHGRKLSVPDPRLSLGRVRGGAIRLGEPQDELIICEGLEDGLSLRLSHGDTAVWASAGSGMLHAVVLPENVRRVIVAGDNDPPGREASTRAGKTFAEGGRAVSIIYPPSGAKDFNQELMERLA